MDGPQAISNAPLERRRSLTIGRLMLGLAVLAVLIWGVIEFIVRPPVEARRIRLLNHHSIRVQLWDMGPEVFTGPGAGEHEEEIRTLAAWHRRRMAEMGGRGVPSSAEWQDEGDRMTAKEEALFRELGGTGMAPVAYRSLK